MASQPLTQAAFIDEVVARVDGISKSDVKRVIGAVVEELGDCISNGYKVNLGGIAIFEPRAKKGRKKGTKVRNPFDGTTKTLRADEPDKVTVKVRVGAALKNALPGPKTKDGQALVKQLLKPR